MKHVATKGNVVTYFSDLHSDKGSAVCVFNLLLVCVIRVKGEASDRLSVDSSFDSSPI